MIQYSLMETIIGLCVYFIYINLFHSLLLCVWPILATAHCLNGGFCVEFHCFITVIYLHICSSCKVVGVAESHSIQQYTLYVPEWDHLLSQSTESIGMFDDNK